MTPVSFTRFAAINGTLVTTTLLHETNHGRYILLNIYRDLLRSATYIPDSLARIRIRDEIKVRFRKAYTAHPKQPLRLEDVKKHVKRLQRAADGHPAELASVLKFAYGRRGAPRRQSVATLIRNQDIDVPEKSQDSADGATKKDAGTQGKDRLDNNPKLAALMKSQKLEGSHFEGLKIRSLQPEVPKTNIWMRKTPVNVAANIKRKWWARTLSIVCPPMDESDWYRLKALSLGTLRESRPPRRTRLHGDEQIESRPSLTNLIGRVKGVSKKKQTVLDARGLRQLYSQIWSISPLLTYHDTKQEWVVQWGTPSTLSKTGIEAVPVVKASQLELFEGIDDLRETTTTKSGNKTKKIIL